jgi:hypothetical protein
MSLREQIRAALSSGSTEETEHPPLSEVGCIEAWPCHIEREQRADGTLVCGECGRVLVEDTTAFKHDPDKMPTRE